MILAPAGALRVDASRFGDAAELWIRRLGAAPGDDWVHGRGRALAAEGLAAGEYLVTATAGDAADAIVVAVDEGATATATLTPRPTTRVTGRVVRRPGDAGVSGCACVVAAAAKGAAAFTARTAAITDARGDFALDAPTGAIAIRCARPDGTMTDGAITTTIDPARPAAIVVPVAAAPVATAIALGVSFEVEPDGARVVEVAPDSAAATAGLRAGDLVIGVGPVALAGLSARGMTAIAFAAPPGATMAWTIKRAGVPRLLHATAVDAAP